MLHILEDSKDWNKYMCGELALTGFEQTENFESGQCLVLAAAPMDAGPLICKDKNIGTSSQ